MRELMRLHCLTVVSSRWVNMLTRSRPLETLKSVACLMAPDPTFAHSAGRGDDMKISERTGKWVEINKSTDADDELTIQVPNGIWAGWLAPVSVKEEDLASFLRAIGWRVELPTSVKHRG
jgi:formylmethanofuran dehydrogenase subunit D